MEIGTIDKIYILGQLRQRGITVLIEELDDLKEELVPFAKGRLDYICQNGGIPEKEKPYALMMAKYFNLPTENIQ
jgi:hypothetical protein